MATPKRAPFVSRDTLFYRSRVNKTNRNRIALELGGVLDRALERSSLSVTLFGVDRAGFLPLIVGASRTQLVTARRRC